jgi:hypothetical protein
MTNHLKPFEGKVINQTLDKLPGLQTPVYPPLLLMTLVPKGHPFPIVTRNLMLRQCRSGNIPSNVPRRIPGRGHLALPIDVKPLHILLKEPINQSAILPALRPVPLHLRQKMILPEDAMKKKGKTKQQILFKEKTKPFLNDYSVQVQDEIKRKKMEEAIRKIADAAEQRIKKLNAELNFVKEQLRQEIEKRKHAVEILRNKNPFFLTELKK